MIKKSWVRMQPATYTLQTNVLFYQLELIKKFEWRKKEALLSGHEWVGCNRIGVTWW